MNPRQVWQEALGELEAMISRGNYASWLKNTSAVGVHGDVFSVAAPNTFAKEWLDTRLRPQIEQVLAGIVGRTMTLEVVVEAFGRPGTSGRKKAAGGAADPIQPALIEEPADDPTSSEEESPRAGLTARVRSSPRQQSRQSAEAASRPARTRPAERWSFDSFVVGPSNRFAFAAARAVAEAPASVYNPLFIHGGVGLGKTHLLHAIANACLEREMQVRYVTCEQFTNDLIDAIQRRQTDDFRAAYRSNDILLIDDIQFLAGKESTQEEFFHTFNDLHSSQRQLVISSDRPPRAIATLEQRLTSRFEWGLIVDVQPPDVETRTAILRARARLLQPPVPDEVIDLLAQRVARNVRELEGALTTVVAYARLNGLPLDAEAAARALAEVTTGRPRPIQPAEVVDAVARYYKLEPRLLRGRQRDREIVVPRQVAMYLMREDTAASLLEIGRELGGRDHSTVLHGWEKIRTEVEADDKLRREVLAIREKLFSNGF